MSFETPHDQPLESAMASARLPYDQTVLVLQGGGALGAYQAGVYEVLRQHEMEPDWVAGISIGAVNAAIIAGNAPQDRITALRGFWEGLGSDYPGEGLARGRGAAELGYRQWSGLMSVMAGVPGFYRPWFLPPWFNRPGTPEATSFYDTAPLRKSLLRYIDFERINHGKMRLSLGAVNIRNGNFVYFDTLEKDRVIGPEHVMASAALPPGFPAVEIDGEPYWDGGLVSNTPLSYVLDQGIARDTLVFQIDLFSSEGPDPVTMDEVQERIKDITFSSRTRLNTDAFTDKYRLRRAIRALSAHVSPEVRDAVAARGLPSDTHDGRVSLVHLINRANRSEIQSKDYEFSRLTLDDHWRGGMEDARTVMMETAWRSLPDTEKGLAVYDYTRADAGLSSRG